MEDLHRFIFATTLNLNIGYYTICLVPNTQMICVTVLPWGKYEYKRLIKGFCMIVDVFQESMEEVFCDMPEMKPFINHMMMALKADF